MNPVKCEGCGRYVLHIKVDGIPFVADVSTRIFLVENRGEDSAKIAFGIQGRLFSEHVCKVS